MRVCLQVGFLSENLCKQKRIFYIEVFEYENYQS
jgi:hypothetical protein